MIRGSELAEILEPDAYRQLCAAHGGVRIYIRRRSDPRLVAVLGEPAAAMLARTLGGEMIVIPRDPDWGTRRARIKDMARLGIRAGHIARKLGCSERWVYRVLSD